VGIPPQKCSANTRRSLVTLAALGVLANAAGTAAGFVTMPSVSQLVCLVAATACSAMIATKKGRRFTSGNDNYP
jgi:uncharacterized membrane protein YccC